MKQDQATQVKLCADCQHKANVHICWKCRNGDMKRSTSDVCNYCGHQPTKLEASAPAMLAALEQASMYHPNKGYAEWLPVVRAINQAISMATGKEG